VDGAIRIRGNPILPQVEVDALVERLRANGFDDSFDVAGNGAALLGEADAE
jgi:hypothetical protein